MRGGKREGAGVKKGMRNAMKPENKRHTKHKYTSFTEEGYKQIEKYLNKNDLLFSTLARIAVYEYIKKVKM